MSLNANSVLPATHKRHYRRVSIHPTDDNGACEVWGEYEETMDGQTFDSDGIIGWLYPLGQPTPWVWLNYAGHPRGIFITTEDLTAWLTPMTDDLTWDPHPKT